MIPLPVTPSGGRVVQLSGRLDAMTAPDLRSALVDIDRESRAGDLVLLDLSGIEAVDAAGMAPLVLGRRRARARAYSLVLAAPSAAVVDLLARTHLTATFRIVPAVEVAAQPA